jgi:NAD(P)-dependent dehydrogenase (short-subunit alcohol dehydrogenase family)
VSNRVGWNCLLVPWTKVRKREYWTLDLGLGGKRALITGGSRGIGKAIARTLLAEGASVTIAARDGQSLRSAAEELEPHCRTCIHWATFDALDNCSVEAMVAGTVERLGGLDIVVNAAATPASVGGSAGVEMVDTADLLADLDVKVLGYLRVARAAAPFIIANGWGRIINIGGLAVRSTGNYAGSIRNAGVVALTKCLADELAEHGVSVTAVHPGATRTERTPTRIAAKAAHDGVTTQQAERLLYGHTLLGRIVEVEEVAALVAFLASPLSAAINGDSLFAGGGARKTIHY